MEKLLLVYLVVINLITIGVYGLDKVKAIRREHRISESTLFCVVLAGGGIGALIAIWCFRHKTRHQKFTIGVPAIILAQVAPVLYMIFDKY